MVLLEIQEISKHFGGLQALDRVSFEVSAGDIFGLIGPNGAGKTTLFNIISGFYPPSKGKVLFEGKPISGLPPQRLVKSGIARTFQLIQLFKKMTVLENVMIGAHLRKTVGPLSTILHLPHARAEESAIREAAWKMLNFVALEDRANELADNIPGGEQRLVGLARALISDPKIVLMDEVAAGLNPYEKKLLAQTIKAIREQGRTVLLIEHDMQFVGDIVDWIIVLNFGVKIAEGPPEVIRKEPKVIESYLGREYNITP